MVETSPFINDFLDFFTQQVGVQPGFIDGRGDWISSGERQSLACRIEGTMRLVRSSSGSEVVSSVQVFVAGYHGLTSTKHRYYLPPPWEPSQNLRAISVSIESDEIGPVYHEVYLP